MMSRMMMMMTVPMPMYMGGLLRLAGRAFTAPLPLAPSARGHAKTAGNASVGSRL
jgi:hypothetical protein